MKKEIKKQFLILLFLLGLSFILLLSLSSFVLAQSQEFNLSINEAKFSVNIFNTIQSDASRIITNLTFFPRQDDRQQASFKVTPEAQISEDSIVFNFVNQTGPLNFSVESTVMTKFFFKEIRENISLINFTVPSELEDYVKDSRYVIMDPYIKNKARQLATKDTVETLYNLAEYVRRSMNYTLASMEIKNSSWIMENKQGVCSHYTILFMALTRSLGIPSRFISGVAYSNKDKVIREHAWAEVWLPEYGWVPYDVTFGEYGWIDSSHIVLKRSVDVSSSVEYSYIGKIDIGNLTINTSVVEAQGKFELPLEMKAFVYREKIGFNSYVPLEITVKNLNNYYVSVHVRVSIAPGVFGESEKVILIKPRGEAKVLFNIQIPELEECESECLATLAVEDHFGNSAETTILIGRNQPRMTLEESENLIKVYSKIYGKQESVIDFYCKAEKDFYYEYENVSITCHVRSPRNVYVSICNQNVCKNVSLAEDQVETVNLEVPAVAANQVNDSVQMQCLTLCIITREQRDVVAVSCVDMKLLATPKVNISSIENTEARYGSKGSMRLVVDSNNALNVNLSINVGKYQEQEIIFLKKGLNTVPIDMATWQMDIGENPVSLKLVYGDKNNLSYEVKKDFVFVVKDVSVFERLFVKIAHLFD